MQDDPQQQRMNHEGRTSKQKTESARSGGWEEPSTTHVSACINSIAVSKEPLGVGMGYCATGLMDS